MTPQSVPKQAFGFFVEEMEEENLLYRLGSHKAIHLNDSATVIWKLCDGSRTVQEIINVLRTHFPGSEGTIAADVQEAIGVLADEGALLEVSSPKPVRGGNLSARIDESRE